MAEQEDKRIRQTKKLLRQALTRLMKTKTNTLLKNRYEKYRKIGVI